MHAFHMDRLFCSPARSDKNREQDTEREHQIKMGWFSMQIHGRILYSKLATVVIFLHFRPHIVHVLCVCDADKNGNLFRKIVVLERKKYAEEMRFEIHRNGFHGNARSKHCDWYTQTQHAEKMNSFSIEKKYRKLKAERQKRRNENENEWNNEMENL